MPISRGTKHLARISEASHHSTPCRTMHLWALHPSCCPSSLPLFKLLPLSHPLPLMHRCTHPRPADNMHPIMSTFDRQSLLLGPLISPGFGACPIIPATAGCFFHPSHTRSLSTVDLVPPPATNWAGNRRGRGRDYPLGPNAHGPWLIAPPSFVSPQTFQTPSCPFHLIVANQC